MGTRNYTAYEITYIIDSFSQHTLYGLKRAGNSVLNICVYLHFFTFFTFFTFYILYI